MHRLSLNRRIRAFPVTIYYAFKQSEKDGMRRAFPVPAGMTFLDGGNTTSGFSISGTWPIRTELTNRAVKASSQCRLPPALYLVCRQASRTTAPTTSRREFVTALKAGTTAEVVAHVYKSSNIAPVGSSHRRQSAPAWAIYTQLLQK